MREAVILMARCPSNGKRYGIRTEKNEAGVWMRTWAFPLREETAKREHYGESEITGKSSSAPGYPGCPYCEKRNIIRCPNCNTCVCVNQGDPDFTCACGYHGELVWGDFTLTFRNGTDR